MSETTEALRQDIDGIRSSMTETMEQIESKVRTTVDTTVEKVRSAFDLEQQVDEHPWLALGLATLAGYLLGSLGDPDLEYRTSYSAAPIRSYTRGESGASADERGYHGAQGRLLAGIANQLGDELNVITTAAAVAAVAFVRDTITGTLPQFEEEYTRLREEEQRRQPPAPASAPQGPGTLMAAAGMNVPSPA